MISSFNLLKFLPQLYIHIFEIINYFTSAIDRNPYTKVMVVLEEQRAVQLAQ